MSGLAAVRREIERAFHAHALSGHERVGQAPRGRGLSRTVLFGALTGAALFLAGCAEDSIFPTVMDEPAPGAETVEIPAAEATPAPAPMATIVPLPVFESTGTTVGQRVAQLRQELDRLEGTIGQQVAQVDQFRASTEATSASYHVLVAAINARLQVGTTPGNPILVGQLGQAQGALDKINAEVNTMTRMASDVASMATSAKFLAGNTKATLGLSGALDEDHRQLRLMQDQLARDQVMVDRMVGSLNTDISRQIAYVTTERANLAALSASVSAGELVAPTNAGARTMPSMAPGSASLAPAAVGSRKPLVVVRFERPDVAYQRQLSEAVNKALQRHPDARFDVVALAPNAAEMLNAQSNADGVVQTLNSLGLGAARVSLASSINAMASVNEVRLYVR